MKTNPILLAITTVTLATPAMIQSAQPSSDEPSVQADQPPRAGLVTVIENQAEAREPRWRIAWKSLTALPVAKRERLQGLVDRANRARAPLGQTQRTVPAPACMIDQI